MDNDLPQTWVFPRSHFGIGCGQGLRVVSPCCQGLQRHHQTQSRRTDCSSNIPPPVQSKVKSPSMTRQPWLTKAVIDHCKGQKKGFGIQYNQLTYVQLVNDLFPGWVGLSKYSIITTMKLFILPGQGKFIKLPHKVRFFYCSFNVLLMIPCPKTHSQAVLPPL